MNRKTLSFTLIIILFSTFCHAEDSREEHLKAGGLSQNERIDRANEITLLADDWNYNAWIKSAKKSLMESEKAGYKKGICRAKVNLLKAYAKLGKAVKSEKLFEEIKVAAENSGDKKSLGLAYLFMGQLYTNINKNKLSLEYYHIAKNLFKEYGFMLFHAAALRLEASVNVFLYSDYKRASEMLKESIEISKKIKDTNGIILSYWNLASFNLNLSLYSTVNLINSPSMKYLQRSLALAKESGNTLKIAQTYMIMSNISFLAEQDSSQVFEYTNKANNAVQSTADTNSVAFVMENIAMIHSFYGHRDSSNYYYSIARDLYERIGNVKGITSVIMQSAENMAAEGKLEEALGLIDTAYNFYLGSADYQSAMEALNRKGEIFIELEKYGEARRAFDTALGLSYEDVQYSYLISIQNNLITLFLAEGDYKNAYEKQYELNIMKDSMNIKDKSMEIAGIQTKMEIERKLEGEKRRKEEDAKALAAKIERRNMIQYSGIFLFLILIFVLTITQAKKNLSYGFINAAIFISFLLLFEFILVVSDPFVDSVTNSEPVYKLLMNFGAALIIVPFHNYGEKKLMNRFRHLKGDS